MMAMLMVFTVSVWGQNGNESPVWQNKVKKIKIREATGLPDYLKFLPGEEIELAQAPDFLRSTLKMRPEDQLVLKKTERDQLGMQHFRYSQTYKGVPVEFSYYYVHAANNRVKSVNGHFIPVTGAVVPVVTQSFALDQAKAALGGIRFMWEDQGEETLLKMETGDPNATWLPEGELVFAPQNTQFRAEEYRLAWKLDVYAAEPHRREVFYVDATSGNILFRENKIHTADSAGVAHTMYSGIQNIVADFTGSGFRMRESGRGGGVRTLNMNNGTSFNAATDFTDADNIWNDSTNNDHAAGDAHWGAEMTYDYFFTQHGRNSYDDNGAPMRSYIHYDVNYANAFWNGSRMTYGDGGGGNRPFCTLDVCGHEFSHGVTGNSAGLVYQDEPGALNESFSDIFGAAIEFWARPGNANWFIGEELGTFRSMSDPNAFFDPDTYKGSYWAGGTFDNGGVHTNSGVQNFWFYLLSTGGTGTNDNGDAYSVNGIGVDSAAAIAYRNLNVYLGPSSEYDDAGFYAVEAASDIFGECSPQMIATMNAWYACGVGRPFGPLAADFEADEFEFCSTPATVQFNNLSVGGLSYWWDFDDGTFSTAPNPSHNYSFLGTYSPTLTAYGCGTDEDTVLKANYILIDPDVPCTSNMPFSGSSEIESCEGRLRDSGGNGNYLSNVISTTTIAPSGAGNVELTFSYFDYVVGGDYIAIYDGADIAAPLIGYYAGTSLPNGGVIASTGPSITIQERTNGSQESGGFELTWSCLTSMENGVEAARFEIFPNPADNAYTIRIDGFSTPHLMITLTNAMGQKIWNEPVNATGTWEKAYDASSLPAGVYFVELTDGESRQTQKLIVR